MKDELDKRDMKIFALEEEIGKEKEKIKIL
jgi:hypothetical protein